MAKNSLSPSSETYTHEKAEKLFLSMLEKLLESPAEALGDCADGDFPEWVMAYAASKELREDEEDFTQAFNRVCKIASDPEIPKANREELRKALDHFEDRFGNQGGIAVRAVFDFLVRFFVYRWPQILRKALEQPKIS